MVNLRCQIIGANRFLRSRFLSQHRFLTVTWILTAKCNLRCRQCGVYEKETEELNTGESVKLIKFLARRGILWISFTGGEPLIREDIGLLVEEAKKENMAIGINSNGILVPKRIHDIKSINKLQLSIDGPEKVHDELREKGAFRAVMEAIESARSNNISVQLTHVLMKNNLDYLDSFLKIVEDLKIPVTVQPGRIRRLYKDESYDLVPSVSDLYQAVDYLIKRKKGGYPWLCNSLEGLRFLQKWPTPSSLPCIAGKLHFAISPSGFMCRCTESNIFDRENSKINLNFEDSFKSIKPGSCYECWCGNLVELNLAYNFNLTAVCSCVKHFLFEKY